MRVSDRTIARNYLKYLFQAKSNYSDTQERIESQHRFEKVSDDVSSANRVLNIRIDKYKNEKQLSNIQSINDKLSMVESTMRSIHEMNVRVYEELGVRAKNTPTGDAGRAAIADEIKAMREEIVQFTNTMYGGKYLFSATNATYAPFSVKDGKVTYNGVDVDSILKRADGSLYYLDEDGVTEKEIPMDDDVYLDIGLGVVMHGSQIEPDTAFKISYSGLDVFGFGMTDPDDDPATDNSYSNNFYNVLTEIEQAIRDNDMDKLETLNTHLRVQNEKYFANVTELGSKTSYLDRLEQRCKDTQDNYDKRINELMGTNYEEESTNQTMNEFILKAVLQMGATILPVSLMDFLK